MSHSIINTYHGCKIESTLCSGYKVEEGDVKCDGWKHVVTPPAGFKGGAQSFPTLAAAIAHAKKSNPPPPAESRFEPVDEDETITDPPAKTKQENKA